jgi:hypothetical protein
MIISFDPTLAALAELRIVRAILCTFPRRFSMLCWKHIDVKFLSERITRSSSNTPFEIVGFMGSVNVRRDVRRKVIKTDCSQSSGMEKS